MANHIHSTGRGGAGNIGEDHNEYVDGDIVREGVVGVSGRPHPSGPPPEYSSGRGGAGNMVPPPSDPAAAGHSVRSEEIVPESATRGPEGYENYHTGRGGSGNVHRDAFGGHSGPGPHHAHAHGKDGSGAEHGGESLLEKAKHAIGLDKKKEGE